MISERIQKALSAFVDGELTPRQRRAVLRLVRQSAEARKYLRLLRQDSQRLKALPRKNARLDFSDQVMKTIAHRRLEQKRAPIKPSPWHARPIWGGIAAAASVLFMVGFSAYLYFVQSAAHDPSGLWSATTAGQAETGSTSESGGNGTGSNPVVHGDNANPDSSHQIPSNVVVQGNNSNTQTPEHLPNGSVPVEEDALTIPIPKMELFGPRTAAIELPVVQTLAKLNKVELREKFQKDAGFRIELPCLNSHRACERLQAAFKVRGVALLLDSPVQNRLKQANLHTNFVVFTEDLSGTDLIQLLEQIAAEDKKANAKPKGELAFNGLIVTSMDQDDKNELGGLLGIDPKLVLNPKTIGPFGLDPQTPIAEVTANQVVQSLAGQGGSSRGSEPVKAGEKKPELRALLLPFNPVRLQAGSAEVKKFLDGRKPLKAGAVQVLLVIREVKG